MSIDILWLMKVINSVVDELFSFVPSIMKIYALSLILVAINTLLLRSRKKKYKIAKYILNSLFFIYTFLRLVPISVLSSIQIQISSAGDWFIVILTFLPYISMILLGKIIKNNKIVKFIFNYHVYFLLFIGICCLINYYNTDIVNLSTALTYSIAVYTGSIILEIGGNSK